MLGPLFFSSRYYVDCWAKVVRGFVCEQLHRPLWTSEVLRMVLCYSPLPCRVPLQIVLLASCSCVIGCWHAVTWLSLSLLGDWVNQWAAHTKQPGSLTNNQRPAWVKALPWVWIFAYVPRLTVTCGTAECVCVEQHRYSQLLGYVLGLLTVSLPSLGKISVAKCLCMVWVTVWLCWQAALTS